MNGWMDGPGSRKVLELWFLGLGMYQNQVAL